MQLGFYFDQTRCTGCNTCVVACKDWHDVPAGRASWRRVITIEEGEFPDLFVAFLGTSCCHCAQPACISVCPADAITKRREDGVVVVDRDKCHGKDLCDLCLQACPYQAPQFRAEPNAKMEMCNLCFDRLEQGKKPICVEACPMRALDAGPLQELRARYGEVKKAEGFAYSAKLEPAVTFRPKVKTL